MTVPGSDRGALDTSSWWARMSSALAAGDRRRGARAFVNWRTIECEPRRRAMRRWRASLRILLRADGVDAAALEALDERLLDLLRLPSGTAFGDAASDAACLRAFARLALAIAREEWPPARACAERALETWREVHDREVDWTCGLMEALIERRGVATVPAMFESIAREHFEQFLALGGADPERWQRGGARRVLADTIEVMQGHLSTRDRRGDPLDVREHADRWVLRFDPCGSGGRAMREGRTARRLIAEARPWTDGKAGVCLYCNHCQQVYEQWPIDAAGFPYLVVEPPLTPAEPCSYTIYKRAEDVPAAVFERCGRRKPGHRQDL